jgi:branched-subunit amino acid aminotransferase/4-amino-4-deoxychorismate lyase
MTALLAADSWLVDDGRVRAVDRHWARFAATCREHGVAAGALTAFRAEVERALPAEGRWFPRVELRAGGDLAVEVRAAPPREPTVVAWVSDVPDPRRAPCRKGPDLERLAGLRERAAAHHAGEAVLADADGRLLEGAFTSLLWWEGEALCVVPDDAPILPGVTRALLIELARERGVPVAQRRPAPPELAGCETWLVSALHGIRAVTRWAGGPPAAVAPRSPPVSPRSEHPPAAPDRERAVPRLERTAAPAGSAARTQFPEYDSVGSTKGHRTLSDVAA